MKRNEPLDIPDESKNRNMFSELLGYDVEKILKIGGLLYIVVSILSASISGFDSLVIKKVTFFDVVIIFVQRVLGGFLSGILYYGIGQMIHILKERNSHEV